MHKTTVFIQYVLRYRSRVKLKAKLSSLFYQECKSCLRRRDTSDVLNVLLRESGQKKKHPFWITHPIRQLGALSEREQSHKVEKQKRFCHIIKRTTAASTFMRIPVYLLLFFPYQTLLTTTCYVASLATGFCSRSLRLK